MRVASVIVSFIALASALSIDVEKRAPAKVYRSCTKPKEIAITFDDGPYVMDMELKATLAKHNAKATYFINTNNWRCAYDDEMIKNVQELFADGHEFGSHTATHKNLTTLSWDKLHSEMWKTEEYLIRVLGVTPALMRPPFGAINDLVLSAANARKLSVILWDFDSEDTLGRSAASTKGLYDQLIAKKVSNALALNHSISNSTVREVIPYALEKLSAAGYKFVTVSECLGIPAYQAVEAKGVKDPATWKC